MKRSIKAVVAILVASMFAMSVTACGSGGDNSGSETKAADNAQEGVAEAEKPMTWLSLQCLFLKAG